MQMQKLRKDCKKSIRKIKSLLNLRNKITNENMAMLPEGEKSKGEEIKITMMNSYEYSIIYFFKNKNELNSVIFIGFSE
jgi:hypothetical protein